ncbi:hypothetical protein, partial [Microbacterium tumbae]
VTAAAITVADAEQAELRRERDLAIAHDRQPYPTAWAYEQACTALNRKTEAIDRVRSVLESEAVVGRSALDYRGLITAALMAAAPVSGPGRVAGETRQPETQAADRVVAHVPTTGTDLHCLRCAPLPLGDIWTAVTAEELEDGGICTQCGTDVLIPQPETQATPCSQPNHCDDDELCAVH